MGLPMFQEPDDVVAEDAASKLDRAAAHQRSSIRRQATIRPGRSQHSERLSLSRSDRRRAEEQASDHYAHLEAELERLRSIRLRNQNRGDRELPSLREVMDLLRRPARDLESDGEENEATTTGMSPVRRLAWPPVSAREAGIRITVGAPRNLSRYAPGNRSGPGSGSISPHRLRLLTPPSSSESSRNASDGRLLDAESDRASRPSGPDRPAEFTPGFAPARGPYRDSPRSEHEDEMPTPPPDGFEVPPYPPLRRVGHLSPRPAQVDGLGDRRRSLSPDAEEETWVTLLTTINDTRSNMNNNNNSSSSSSSAATSFASSIGLSRSSQNTTASTSFGEIGQADDGCDLDLPSGITPDHVREIREEHRREQRLGQPDGPLPISSRGSAAVAAASTPPAAAASLAEAPTEPQALLRQHEQRRTRRVELTLFQDILERMQRREEIPDEWWAAVGLTPIT